ncbi:hypothetical protein ACFL6S_25120 [Candidatus Poribacteria bacterium]
MDNDKKLILPYELPGNLDLLNKHEEEICKKSIFEIKKSEKLSDHLEIVHESLNLLYFLSHDYRHQTDDDLTVQCLGTRMFNSTVSSLKLLLAGYYQSSLMFQRDVMETWFLLDFFTIDQSEISIWKSCSNKERKKSYAPWKIRSALDERDGFTGQERRERYEQLCEYAVHPSYAGFKLLAPDGLVKIGPFFHFNFLSQYLEVLALFILNGSMIYTYHFPLKKLPVGVLGSLLKPFLGRHIDFLDKVARWSGKYYELHIGHYDISEIRGLMESL